MQPSERKRIEVGPEDVTGHNGLWRSLEQEHDKPQKQKKPKLTRVPVQRVDVIKNPPVLRVPRIPGERLPGEQHLPANQLPHDIAANLEINPEELRVDGTGYTTFRPSQRQI